MAVQKSREKQKASARRRDGDGQAGEVCTMTDSPLFVLSRNGRDGCLTLDVNLAIDNFN